MATCGCHPVPPLLPFEPLSSCFNSEPLLCSYIFVTCPTPRAGRQACAPFPNIGGVGGAGPGAVGHGQAALPQAGHGTLPGQYSTGEAFGLHITGGGAAGRPATLATPTTGATSSSSSIAAALIIKMNPFCPMASDFVQSSHRFDHIVMSIFFRLFWHSCCRALRCWAEMVLRTVLGLFIAAGATTADSISGGDAPPLAGAPGAAGSGQELTVPQVGPGTPC